MKRAPNISVNDFLSGLDPQVRRLAQAARKRILAAVPQATERVRLGWRLIGYNAPVYFAFIAFEGDHVRIGFEWGVMLADLSGLLEGTGSQVRYVPIRRAEDLQSPALPALLRAAAAIVPPPRSLHRLR